ncbi:hypothetical protein EUGRSUZ_D01168 [Eucalyptus grandis]|uniref:Uncharacterized protein n=2 Tax=Eucalyptus grandis TaxID=71139 RepID=A0ACC3L5N5_EUCGR|nr:hypothetical protein EUGRSUZ_D01168 [Eucalyptus grandis]
MASPTFTFNPNLYLKFSHQTQSNNFDWTPCSWRKEHQRPLEFHFPLASLARRDRIRRASSGCNMQSAAFLPRLPQHHSHLCRSDNFLVSHHSTWTCPKWKLAASRIAVTRMSPPASTSHSLSSETSLAALAPLEAILFDIDGTLCDSDPIHYYAFREMLQEVGFNGGIPITEEFFVKKISGMHNEELCHVLFPDWEIQKASKFMEDKEEMFQRLASEKLEPVKGLPKLLKWIEGQGMRRAAVTNAPRPNAELILSLLGLNDFFETLVIGSECERAKPFPHPYLKALEVLGVSEKHAFVFEHLQFLSICILIVLCGIEGLGFGDKSWSCSRNASRGVRNKESGEITDRSRGCLRHYGFSRPKTVESIGRAGEGCRGHRNQNLKPNLSNLRKLDPCWML